MHLGDCVSYVRLSRGEQLFRLFDFRQGLRHQRLLFLEVLNHLRDGQFHQDFSLFHAIADVLVDLLDITADFRVHGRLQESLDFTRLLDLVGQSFARRTRRRDRRRGL